MTQVELAERLRIPQSTIARIEGGTVDPRTSTLLSILRATGVRLEPAPAVGNEAEADAIRRALLLNVPARVARSIGRTARVPRKSPIRILRRLRRFAVPFVLVDELAEVAHGSPASVRREIRVVHAPTDVAQERIRMALDDLRAAPAGRSTYKTDAGRLHLATASDAGDDYETLRRNAVRLPLSGGVLVWVAAIEDLIRVRLARGSREDQLAAAVLRAIAEAHH
jgi:transcriptional regulator with XRE-family HTH domain